MDKCILFQFGILVYLENGRLEKEQRVCLKYCFNLVGNATKTYTLKVSYVQQEMGRRQVFGFLGSEVGDLCQRS
jgi:hypothetical protein